MAAATRSAGSTPDLAIAVQTHQFDATALPWLKAQSSALPEIQAHPLSLPVREKQGVVHFEEMASRPDQHWALAPMLHRQLDGGPRRRASAATHAASLVVALAGAGPASTAADVALLEVFDAKFSGATMLHAYANLDGRRLEAGTQFGSRHSTGSVVTFKFPGGAGVARWVFGDEDVTVDRDDIAAFCAWRGKPAPEYLREVLP